MSDPCGRHLLISGHVSSFLITMLHIYVPKKDNPNLFQSAFDLIAASTVVRGEFNCNLDL